MNRREFLRNAGAVTTAAAVDRVPCAWAETQPRADYTFRIAPIHLEIAPGKTVKTTAFNGSVPGKLIRLREGTSVTIDVVNDTGAPDIIHWHGLHIPSREDGSSEEGSPVSAPHGGIQELSGYGILSEGMRGELSR